MIPQKCPISRKLWIKLYLRLNNDSIPSNVLSYVIFYITHVDICSSFWFFLSYINYLNHLQALSKIFTALWKTIIKIHWLYIVKEAMYKQSDVRWLNILFFTDKRLRFCKTNNISYYKCLLKNVHSHINNFCHKICLEKLKIWSSFWWQENYLIWLLYMKCF